MGQLKFEEKTITILSGDEWAGISGQSDYIGMKDPGDVQASASKGGIRSFFVRLFTSREHCTRLGDRIPKAQKTCKNHGRLGEPPCRAIDDCTDWDRYPPH